MHFMDRQHWEYFDSCWNDYTAQVQFLFKAYCTKMKKQIIQGYPGLDTLDIQGYQKGTQN